jgi:thioredoxin reductase
MIEKKCDVAIIGGGPAGLSAATTTSEQGASTVLVNDSHSLGGHFYKSLPVDFRGLYTRQDHGNIQELRTRTSYLEGSQVEILDQARVWGIFRGPDHNFQIFIEHPENDSISINAQAVILAPGVYDRPLPFPGWELPGVMTPGAVQMSLKKQGLLPGKRILVSGTGPLQMVVASALVNEGADVVALLDTSGVFDGMRYAPGALGGFKHRFGEFFHSVLSLVRSRVPVLFRHAAFRALGNKETGVEGVVIGRVDPNGHPIPGTERTLEVDTICCAYGFNPSIALTLHLGIEHVYNSNLGANIPWHDDKMGTSTPGVFVAGDVTGAGGKYLADLQGVLAGLSTLEQIGILTTENVNQQRSQLAPAVRREGRFSRFLWTRYRIREGLLDLADDDTLVCRCENITLGDIKQSLDRGGRDLYGVKLRTRMGMGSCQGRYCMMNTALLISQQTGCNVDQTGIHSVRPPLTPTRLKSIAAK